MKNSRLQTEYYEAADKLTDKKNEIEIAEKEADKWRKVSDIAKQETEYAQFELAEAEKLKKELLSVVDGDSYLKEQCGIRIMCCRRRIGRLRISWKKHMSL